MSSVAILRLPEALTAEDVDAINELLEQRFASRVDDGIERRDPWDMPEEEYDPITLTSAELAGRGYLGDRGAYDAHDDLSDLQPFERTTSYPWGGR